MTDNSKQAVTDGLKHFNQWFDEFIIAVAKPLAMLGFAMGTVDIFTRGGLATQYWFALAWSIVQATTIDGLFFAVWYRVFDLRWQRGNWRQIAALLFIGAFLAVVAFATNAILGYQQLWGLSDSQQAMVRLGIDPQQFTLLRAVLVVAVAVMIAYVYRTGAAEGGSTSKQHEPTGEPHPAHNEPPVNHTEPPHEPLVNHSEPREPLTEPSIDESEPREPVSEPLVNHFEPAGEPLVNQSEPREPLVNHSGSASERMSEPREPGGEPLQESEPVQLGFIEQAMYDALMDNPDEASVLLGLAQVQDIGTFTQEMRRRYPQYAGYLTEQRVANVLQYAHEQGVERTPTDELEGESPLVLPSREVVLETLRQQPGWSLRRVARETGIPYTTLRRWKLTTPDAD